MRFLLLAVLIPFPTHADTALDGAELYETHCLACHGEGAIGGNSPDIRGVTPEDVRIFTQGVEEMPEIDLTPEEIQAIGTYLSALTW